MTGRELLIELLATPIDSPRREILRGIAERYIDLGALSFACSEKGTPFAALDELREAHRKANPEAIDRAEMKLVALIDDGARAKDELEGVRRRLREAAAGLIAEVSSTPTPESILPPAPPSMGGTEA